MRHALLLFTAATLLGALLTIIMGQEPGFLIGLFLVIGSVAAATAVRRGAAHTFIPLPALAYLVLATVTGMVHDSGILNSSRAYLLNFLIWIGGAFAGVVTATVLVVLIALGRWLLNGRLVFGQLPATGPAASGRVPSRPGGRDERGGRDRRDRAQQPETRDPWGSRDSRDSRPLPQDWGSRENRDSRGNRDQRGDRGSRANSGSWGNQGRRDDWDRRDDRGQRDDWERRDERGMPGSRDPRDERRPPAGPRDIW